jgi:hypothetical protein
MNTEDESHLIDMLKAGYMVEFRYLNKDPDREPVFVVYIKEFDELVSKIGVIAKGYSPTDYIQAFKNSYIRFNQVKGGYAL